MNVAKQINEEIRNFMDEKTAIGKDYLGNYKVHIHDLLSRDDDTIMNVLLTSLSYRK